MTDLIQNIDHTIHPELLRAYRTAIYVIYGDGEDIVLKIDEVNLDLAALMKKLGITSAALITAFNPHSVLSTAEVNMRNHSALIADIHALGLKSLSAEGSDPSHIWSSEPGILILGISLADAESMADRYKQNAFVWIPRDDGFVSLNLRHPVGGSIIEN
jgi:hypothetical protein